MIWIAALTLGSSALGAGNDQLEIGGLWGTPGSTDATAVYWNPAGLGADGEAATVIIEVAPTGGGVTVDRDDPYNGGPDALRGFGVIPFIGASGRAGPVGFGVALSVPNGSSGTAQDPEGPIFQNIVAAGTRHIYGTGGLSVGHGPVRVGAAMSVVMNSFETTSGASYLPLLAGALSAETGAHPYDDSQLEDPRYSLRTESEVLKGNSLTGSVGMRVQLHDTVSFAAAYLHGVPVAVEGEAKQTFSCPPTSDPDGRFGIELKGLCFAEVETYMGVIWRLPFRVHGAFDIRPIDSLRIRPMGGFVAWSSFDQYEILLDGIVSRNPEIPTATAEGIEGWKNKARSLGNTGWGGLDVKWDVDDRFTVGARGVFDRHAVPSFAVQPSSFDTDTVLLGALAAYKVDKRVQIGVSGSHQIKKDRVITDSALVQSLSRDVQPADETWAGPQMNGTYGGSISRLGVSLRMRFGAPEDAVTRPSREAEDVDFLD